MAEHRAHFMTRLEFEHQTLKHALEHRVIDLPSIAIYDLPAEPDVGRQLTDGHHMYITPRSFMSAGASCSACIASS